MYALLNFRSSAVDSYELIRQVARFSLKEVANLFEGQLVQAVQVFVKAIADGVQAPLEDFNERFMPRISFDVTARKWSYKGRKTKAVKEHSFSHLMGYLLNHKGINLTNSISHEKAFRVMNVPFRKAFPSEFPNLRQKVATLNKVLAELTGIHQKFFMNYGADSVRFANPVLWWHKKNS